MVHQSCTESFEKPFFFLGHDYFLCSAYLVRVINEDYFLRGAMERLADDVCSHLITLHTLVQDDALISRASDFAIVRRGLHTTISQLLAHENENEKTMAALRIYERCGARIESLQSTSMLAVFLTQIQCTTTLKDLVHSARLTSSVTTTAITTTEAFFTTVVRCIGTGNDINDVHEFRKLMTRVVSLCGSWAVDELCIDISKFKESMHSHRLERVYAQLPLVVRAISHWHAHSNGKQKETIDEVLFTSLPRHFIEEAAPRVYTVEETTQSIQDVCTCLDSYTNTIDSLIQTLGSIMQRFRMEIRTSSLDETLRQTQWSLLDKDACRNLLDAFERSFSTFGQLHASTIGYKTKFKELIQAPFQRNKVWFECERDKLLVSTCVCFLCMFIESTYFASHEHDRWLYNVPLSKTDQKANDDMFRSMLLDPSSISISIRKNAAKRSTKNKHMLHDLQAFSKSLRSMTETDPNPRNPYFWTDAHLALYATTNMWVDSNTRIPHESFFHTPAYHPPLMLFPQKKHALNASGIAHGYGMFLNGKNEQLTIEPVEDVKHKDDVPELFLWKPQRVVYSFAKEESQLRERDYAYIGRTSAFATVCELCATPDNAFRRLQYHESPLALYHRSVLQGQEQSHFLPFSKESYNPFLPSLATEYMPSIDESRKQHLDYALNMYCLRAWLQYYCIINGLVVQGNDGRFMFPFSVRMLIPDMDTSGRSHSMIRSNAKPSEWVAITLQYGTIDLRRKASYCLSKTLSLSIEEHERISFSMGETEDSLVIGFPSSEFHGVSFTGSHVSVDTDGSLYQNGTLIQVSPLTHTVLRCAHPLQQNARIQRIGDVAKTFALFSTDICRGIPNLFEFAFVSILLSLTHDATHGLPRCCPNGMTSLSESHQKCMIPYDDQPSPLYDLPFFSFETTRGRVMAIDLTMPLWNAISKRAYRSAEVQLTHTYALPLYNAPTAHALFPESQLRSRLFGMVFRAMISVYTLNPITFANEDSTHKMTESILVKLDRTELVFTQDVRAKSAQAGAAHIKAKAAAQRNADTPITSRTGSKQATDAFYISSPFMSLGPLLHLDSLKRVDGSIDNAKLERFLTAFGYNPPGVSHLDIAERDSPIFPFGHVQYAQQCLASSAYMRFVYAKRDGKGRTTQFTGLSDVCDLDTRGSYGAFVAELQARILPRPMTLEHGVVLHVPGLSTPFDATLIDRYARIFLKTSEKLDSSVWTQTHVFQNGWCLFERADNRVCNDIDAISSIEAALYWTTTSDQTLWRSLTAASYLARYIANSHVDYNATMRALTVKMQDFDALYKTKCITDTKSVSNALLNRLLITIQDERVPIDVQRDAEILVRTNVSELIMTGTLSDVMAFLTRLALLQCMCNILLQPEYERGVLTHVHTHIFEAMIVQINALGNILAPYNERESLASNLVSIIQKKKESTPYFVSSIQNENKLGIEFQRILRCVYSCATIEHTSTLRVRTLTETSRKRKHVDVEAMTEARRVSCKDSLKTLVGSGVSKPYTIKLSSDEPCAQALETSSRFRMAHLTVDTVNALRLSLWTNSTGGTLNIPKKTLHAKLVTKPIFAHVDANTYPLTSKVSCWFERAREHDSIEHKKTFDVHYVSSQRCDIFNKDETFEWDVFVFSQPDGGALFNRDITETDAKCAFEYHIGDDETIEYIACIDTIATPIVIEEDNKPRRRFYCAHVMSSVNNDRSKSTLRNTHDNTAHFAIIVVEDSKIIQIQHQICIGVKN